jgi:hypothetical protein
MATAKMCAGYKREKARAERNIENTEKLLNGTAISAIVRKSLRLNRESLQNAVKMYEQLLKDCG